MSLRKLKYEFNDLKMIKKNVSIVEQGEMKIPKIFFTKMTCTVYIRKLHQIDYFLNESITKI